jgi:hypothetical protein
MAGTICALAVPLLPGIFREVKIRMNDRVADFADTYSKMTDEELSRVVSGEKSLVDEARVALQSEVKRRRLASPAEDGIESGG